MGLLTIGAARYELRCLHALGWVLVELCKAKLLFQNPLPCWLELLRQCCLLGSRCLSGKSSGFDICIEIALQFPT